MASPLFANAPSGHSKAYKLINLRDTTWVPKSVTALAWLGDTLVVAEFGGVSKKEKVTTSQGKIWLLSGVTTARGAEDVSREEILSNLPQPMGLYVENGVIYIHQKGGNATEIWKAVKGEKGWKAELFASGWGQDEPYWWHSWPGGLLKRGNDFYFNFSAITDQITMTGSTWPPQYKGSLIKLNALDPKQYEVVANGMRTNAALFEGPFKSLMGPDVQGEWKPDNQIIQIQAGRFYGHSHQGQIRKATSPPAVGMPQGDASKSPGDGVYLKSGPFAGQLLVGDQSYRGINRYHLERINGELQGTVIDFLGTQYLPGMSSGHPWALETTPDGKNIVFGCAGGWWVSGPSTGSLGMLVPTGETGFEVYAIRNRDSITMEIEFTKAIDPAQAVDMSKYKVNTWTSKPGSGYGHGAKEDDHAKYPVSVSLVTGSDKKVHLKFNPGDLSTGTVKKNGDILEGLGYTVLFTLSLQSASGEDLYDQEVYYTLNQFGPGEDPVPGCTDKNSGNFNPKANDDDGSCTATSSPVVNRGRLIHKIQSDGSAVSVDWAGQDVYKLQILDISGTELFSKTNIQGRYESGPLLKSGVYIVIIHTSSERFTSRIYLY